MVLFLSLLDLNLLFMFFYRSFSSSASVVLLLCLTFWFWLYVWICVVGVRRMIKNWTKIDEYSVCLWTCDFVFSAHNWLLFRVCVCFCKSVLVWWVRNFMYSLAVNSARVRISFVCLLSIRFSVLEKKLGKIHIY